MSTQVQPTSAGQRRDGATKPPPERIVIQYPTPAVDDGRYAAKRVVGDTITAEADIFRDGHDIVRAVVRYKPPQARNWREVEMHKLDAHLGGVRWAAEFEVDQPGRWEYTIQAWTDVFGTWRDELQRKVAAHQYELAGEISEGVQLLQRAAGEVKAKSDMALIEHAISALSDPDVPQAAKHDVALGPELFSTVERIQPRHGSVTIEPPMTIEVDRTLAKFSAWYELFPRSWGGLHGVQHQLPRLEELGFDIIYLPPIHPIGHTNRKGKNNSLSAAPADPGSPWAIGDETGGHDAVHPDLGTLDDLKDLAKTAKQHNLEIALDFAIQCSADHPWLHEHPEWFHRRPDGTLKYAENPPKRYQDIYNVNRESPDWQRLWDALLKTILHWVDAGVTVFRVDNPHTKPFEFWRWLIEKVHAHNRDVIFLAEAFTRRSVMRHLAKIGFTQSYTYFTWKNSRWELSEYVSELALTDESDYFRPNFFANTPDILHEYLQHGGRPAFEARVTLAATLSPSYGIYSGYENFENVPVREGSEEYLNSEKFEVKRRALDGPLLPFIQRLNHIRRENKALHELTNVTFLDTANEALIAYAKHTHGNTIITIVSIDPHQAQEGLAIIPANLGLPPSFTAHDLLADERYIWRIGANYVRFDPGVRQAHIIRVEI